MAEVDSSKSDTNRPGLPWRAFRLVRRVIVAGIALTLLYVLICLIGMLPINRDFQPYQGEDGVEIFVYGDFVHSEVIVPLVNEQMDWRPHFPPTQFRAEQPYGTHVAIGWGDRKFYTETPRWADLKLSTTLRAMLLPTRCIMHVHHLNRPQVGNHCRRVTISPQQYRQLTKFILDTFHRDAGGEMTLLADVSYGDDDAFYRAVGRYHLLNTCNCWTGRSLKASGVRTGIWTIAPQGILLHLPKNSS